MCIVYALLLRKCGLYLQSIRKFPKNLTIDGIVPIWHSNRLRAAIICGTNLLNSFGRSCIVYIVNSLSRHIFLCAVIIFEVLWVADYYNYVLP